LPFVSGELPLTGLVGGEVSSEQAAQLARTAAINAVAAVADLTGGVDAIGRVVKVVVYVASTSGFADQPAVANGASDVLGEIFGEAGRHARSAVGVAVLPKNSPVEVELIVQVHATPTIHPL
jgi:enamine deaminase RidA (YjgF/YER057c/UK114 family)